MKRQRDCADCGAAVGYRGREHCWRCWRRITEAAAKAACPGCGKMRVLEAGTGACVLCSRVCAGCGHPVRSKEAILCRSCRLKERQRAAQRQCPRCGHPGYLREDTGWCGSCSRPGPPRQPPQVCTGCGELRRHAGLGLCGRCWQRHPGRPIVAVGNLISRLDDPPGWLGEFAAHVAAGFTPARAAGLVGRLGQLLADGGSRHPHALLERSRQLGRGRSPGTLARTLEDFFAARGLALPSGRAGQLAAGRRQRRIDAVPEPLRLAASAFAHACLQARERARLAGTRPRADSTIEHRLSAIRDLAIFLIAQRGKDDWATADVHDIEAFLGTRPASRRSRLTALRHFFTWARASKLVLVDPTRGLTAREPRGFRGPTVGLALQRQLFRRWTTNPGAHPHEALTGLLALLHGATCEELRGLTVSDINPADQTARLGRRPQPTPMDPASWAAVERCLGYRDELRTANPHLLVTRQTKASQGTASAYYLSHVLDPAGVRPRLLRSTRLAELVTSMDPKLVSAAFGMRPEGATHYLTDHVDPARLSGELLR
jgi:site-specific recombinase XerD